MGYFYEVTLSGQTSEFTFQDRLVS